MSFFKRLVGTSESNFGEVLTPAGDRSWVSSTGNVINQVSSRMGMSSDGTVYTQTSGSTVVGSDGSLFTGIGNRDSDDRRGRSALRNDTDDDSDWFGES